LKNLKNKAYTQQLSFRAACKAKHENAVAMPVPIFSGEQVNAISFCKIERGSRLSGNPKRKSGQVVGRQG
jgi:hypothetical protein